MPSMDETMSEVFDLANEDADEGDGRPDESQGEEVKEEPETEEKPEGDPKPEGDQEPESEEETGTEGDETEGDPQDGHLESIAPPARWSDEDKEAFTALPRDAKAIMSKREGEREAAFTQKTQEIAESKRLYESIEESLSPRRQGWAMQGMSEAQAISQVLELSDWASRDPSAFIQWIAQNNNVDLSDLVYGEDDEYEDPAVQESTRKVAELENRLNQRDNDEVTMQDNQIQAQVEAFASDKDESGAITHPHFESVRVVMGSLLSNGAATDFQDAYDQAIWANPDIRQGIQATNNTQIKSKDNVRRKKESAEAKKASRTNVRGSGGSATKETESLGSMDETLAAAYESAVNAAD
jgi:hypothetical protein